MVWGGGSGGGVMRGERNGTPLSLMSRPCSAQKKEGYMLERRGLVGGHASHPRRGKLRPSPSHAAKNKKEHSQITQDGHTRASQECDRQPARGTTLTTYPPTHPPNRPTTDRPPPPQHHNHPDSQSNGPPPYHPPGHAHRAPAPPHSTAQMPPSSPPQAPPPPRPTAARSTALTAASPPLPAP